MQKRTSPSRRDRKLPPNYLSGAFQRQMLLLFAALVLVLVLMKIAAQPSTWAWMWGAARGRGDLPGTVDTGATTHRSDLPLTLDPVPAAASSPAGSAQDRSADGGIPAELQTALGETVKDDTFFRSAERPVWFQLLSWLRDADDRQFASPSDLSSLQLLQQMPAYRGHLVRVHGVVRRAVSVTVTDQNPAGISSYWQCWLQDDAGTAPIVVYTLRLPSEFPVGDDLREPAAFTGLAFKRWAYQAQNGLLTAPVVLAQTADWTPRTMPEKRPLTTGWLLASVVGVVATSLVVVRWIFAGSRRTRKTALLALLGTILASADVGLGASGSESELAEILALHKLDASQWRRFVDGKPLDDEEQEPLCRVLYVVPRLEAAEIAHRQQQSTVPGVELAERPDAARGRLFRVEGDVAAARAIPLPPESARRFGYSLYYEVLLQSPRDSHPRIVYAREIPRAWREARSIGDLRWPASCVALFLKTGAGPNGAESLLFAADRIAWHPKRADPSAGVNAGMAQLGSAGVDVGLFEDVAQKQPLVAQDRECFYQMLAAARHWESHGPLPDRASAVEVASLLQGPSEFAGQLFTFSGTARRALRVEVSDADIRQRFGLDHYYEVEVFQLLPQPLKLTDSRDGQAYVYRSFPITVCLTDLPSAIAPGAEIQQEVRVTGWFFKLWSYRSRFVDATGEQMTSVDSAEKRQISPLLIGVSIDSIRPTETGDPGIGWAIACGFVATLLTIGLVARWYRRGDQAFVRWRKSRASPASGLDSRPSDDAAESDG